MIKETVHSFPVPTPANPSAIYDQVEVRVVRDEQVDASPGDKLAEIQAKLAHGRNLNHAAVVEEHKRRTDKEATKRAYKAQDAANDKLERQAEMEAQGLTPEYAHLMDTAAYARRAQNMDDEPAETDVNVTAYERSVKRVLASSKGGKERLMEDLELVEERNAKKRRGGTNAPRGDTLHISKANAAFNKQVSKSLASDRHSQALKQSLERGTAV